MPAFPGVARPPLAGRCGWAAPSLSIRTIRANKLESTAAWDTAPLTLPRWSSTDKERIRAIIKEFAAQDVALAEVGAWVNMLDLDPEKRRKNMAYVQERLTLAEELGTRCCVDIAGSYNPKAWDGPDAKNLSQEFVDATVENCRKLIDAVKPARTKFTIEMMPFSFPSGPDEYLRLIRRWIGRPLRCILTCAM